MTKIAIVNGPNLNLLGTREPDIYGVQSFEDYYQELAAAFADIRFSYFQSNVEGELITKLQQLDGAVQGIVLNAAGYSHTSVALADAVGAIGTPVVEVHISNIHAREAYREHSLSGAKAAGVITGFGLAGYRLAVEAILQL